jgi:hypothetical protein
MGKASITKSRNRTGAKWTKGGSMSRKKGFYIDFSNFEEYAEMLENLGADLKEIFESAMEQAAEDVQEDTIAAVAKGNLPAGGKYSQGDTEDAVIRNPKVEWQGTVGEIKLGFDKTKPGAGGFLITGTPKMQPDYALEKIYGSKSYENKIKKQIEEHLQEEIDARIGG